MGPVDQVEVNAQRVTGYLLTLDPRSTGLEGQSLEITGSTGPAGYEASFLATQGKQTDFLVQYVASQGTAETVMQNALVLSIPAAALLVDPAGQVVPIGTAVYIY